MTEAEARTIDEAFTSACSATSLKVETEKRGAADLMIAAGWNNVRVGSALMRLISEWDGSEKSRAGTPTDLILLASKLKTLGAVKAQVAIQASKWGADRPEAVAGAVILNWLDGICHECGGLKFVPVPNAPALSARMCRPCDGTGRARVPAGQLGKRLQNWMDKCVGEARTNMSKSLRQSMERA